MSGTNTLAYYKQLQIKDGKIFATLGPVARAVNILQLYIKGVANLPHFGVCSGLSCHGCKLRP
jgi:hypothetical protein